MFLGFMRDLATCIGMTEEKGRGFVWVGLDVPGDHLFLEGNENFL